MIAFLKAFKSFIKFQQIRIDNNIFKLHYKFTVIILLVFSILVTSKQYFGDPIKCDSPGVKKELIDSYCWIYGTYTIKNTLKEDILSGLGPYTDPRKHGPAHDFHLNRHNDIYTQKYYQWVGIIFCLQALLFYIPRYLWKTWEGGRLKLLMKDLTGPITPSSWNKENKESLICYMLSGHYSHNFYALRFAFCELLNLVNVICQIFLMDWFLTGQFTGYGIAIATYNGINPMTAVFPKLTKCTYYKYGPSGTIEKIDALCVLPLNIVNEKLFLFLWFWFLLLTAVTLLELICRAIMFLFPRIRMYLLMARAKSLPRTDALIITKKISFGDFFILYLLGKNLNTLIYKDLLISIANILTDKVSPSYEYENALVV